MDTVVRRLAARVHNLRVERGLTQEALASRAKLHPGYLSALERGQKIPRLTTLEQLARGLDVELSILMNFPSEKASGNDRVNEEIELIAQRLRRCEFDAVRRIRKAVEDLTAR